MRGKRLTIATVAMGTTVLLSIPSLTVIATGKQAAKPAKENREECYQCHDEVKALKEGSKHMAIACSACHSELAQHPSVLPSLPYHRIHSGCTRP